MVFKTQQIKLEQSSIIHHHMLWLRLGLGLTFALPLIGFWRTWQWYFNRVNASIEEAFGLIVIVLFLIHSAINQLKTTRQYYQFPLWPIAIMLVLYGLSYLWPVPPLIRAAIPFITMAMIFYKTFFGQNPPISFWPLILLCLPLVPSLQFYLGYPARIVSAKLTVAMLQLQGLPVRQSGTYLQWQNQLLQFDAPCSGVVMLWAGLFLTYFIGWIIQLNALKTLLATLIAMVFILFGNVLRACSLFYLEVDLFPYNEPWLHYLHYLHYGVGIVAFLISAVGIAYTMKRLQSW